MARNHTHGFDYLTSYVMRGVDDVSLPGVPHASSEDDVYRGFFIPKGPFRFSWSLRPLNSLLTRLGPTGTVVIANAWYVGRHPSQSGRVSDMVQGGPAKS